MVATIAKAGAALRPGCRGRSPTSSGMKAASASRSTGCATSSRSSSSTSTLLFTATAAVLGGGARRSGQGSLSHLCPRRLLLSTARRLARRPLPGQVPHHPLPQPGLLRGPRLPGPVRQSQDRLLHRTVPDCARLGRHQAVRLGVCRRPIRPDEQVARPGRLRRLLLDHQLRLLLRVAAHALVPEASRPGRRVRHSRHSDARRDRDLLAGPSAVRPRAASAAQPQLVPARRQKCALLSRPSRVRPAGPGARRRRDGPSAGVPDPGWALSTWAES